MKAVKKIKNFWKKLGPGLITGASDDDPSGIATYSQAGAQFGLNILWTMPLALPLMAAIQYMCGSIGRVNHQQRHPSGHRNQPQGFTGPPQRLAGRPGDRLGSRLHRGPQGQANPRTGGSHPAERACADKPAREEPCA